jgi:hypothetical protein
MAAEAKTQPTQEAKRAQSTPTGAQQPPAPKPDAAESPKEPAAATRVDLDATQITGNRELPRVLYVVPWKRADLGEMSGKPAKSLLDEVLAPVDRDVFRRQNRYHDALQTEAAAPSADAPKGER